MALTDVADPAITETISLAAILAFERRAWRTPGARVQAIRDDFDMTETRYCQVLNQVIDMPAALKADPVTVNRLRSQRARRLAFRAGQSGL